MRRIRVAPCSEERCPVAASSSERWRRPLASICGDCQAKAMWVRAIRYRVHRLRHACAAIRLHVTRHPYPALMEQFWHLGGGGGGSSASGGGAARVSATGAASGGHRQRTLTVGAGGADAAEHEGHEEHDREREQKQREQLVLNRVYVER